MPDIITEHEGLPHVHPMAINHTHNILTQYTLTGDIERQVILTQLERALLFAFLDSPGGHLFREQSMEVLGSNFGTVKRVCFTLNKKLKAFNLRISATLETGHILMHI